MWPKMCVFSPPPCVLNGRAVEGAEGEGKGGVAVPGADPLNEEQRGGRLGKRFKSPRNGGKRRQTARGGPRVMPREVGSKRAFLRRSLPQPPSMGGGGGSSGFGGWSPPLFCSKSQALHRVFRFGGGGGGGIAVNDVIDVDDHVHRQAARGYQSQAALLYNPR